MAIVSGSAQLMQISLMRDAMAFPPWLPAVDVQVMYGGYPSASGPIDAAMRV